MVGQIFILFMEKGVDESLGLATTFLTALLGGGVSSALLTSVLDARRQERALLRNKLEELYTEFDKLARNLSDMHSLFKRYVDGDFDFSMLLKQSSDIVDSLPETTIEKIDSLSAIYFPDVTLPYRSFLTARDKFSNIIMVKPAVIIEMSPEFKAEISESYDYLMELDKLARKSILRCAEKINLPFWKSLGFSR